MGTIGYLTSMLNEIVEQFVLGIYEGVVSRTEFIYEDKETKT